MEANLISGVSATVDAYRRLELDSVGHQWVEDILNGNFCEEVADVPVVIKERWGNLCSVVDETRKWIEINKDHEAS